jgi:hypothetical protein
MNLDVKSLKSTGLWFLKGYTRSWHVTTGKKRVKKEECIRLWDEVSCYAAPSRRFLVHQITGAPYTALGDNKKR